MYKDKKKIGEFIQKLRKEKNLTQYELADMIPIGREAISKWERGKSAPSKSSILRLGEIFDVSVEEILSGKRGKKNKDLLFDLYDEKNKLRKYIKILVIILFIMFFIVLLYVIINIYNSIKVYTINCNENDILITNGIFVTTKNKIYFNLGNIQNQENIANLKLYYNDNTLIYESDNNNIILFDYYGYDEFFSFDDINVIINNLYLEVTFKKTGETKKVKLNVKKDFSNNYKYFFNKKRKNVVEEQKSNIEVLNINKIKEKIKGNIYKYNNHYITIFDEANIINMLYDNKKEKVEWNYNVINDALDVNVYINNTLINSFYKNNKEIKCNIDNCDKNADLIKEFYDLMAAIMN